MRASQTCWFCTVAFAVVASSGVCYAQDATSDKPIDAFVLVDEFDRLAQADLWPEFDPRSTPLAVFDGERTYLFRHPSPPKEFQPVTGHEGVFVMKGRHPAVVANSSAEIGGVTVGTVQLGSVPASQLTQTAAVVIHETFHVFERAKHPGWAGNIAVLFEWPVDDVDLLTLRRVETTALRRALDAKSTDECGRWAAAAVLARQQRFDEMDAKFVAFERGEELNEGLAQYVEYRASKLTPPELPEDGFAPDAMRTRCYASGQAWGLLLDRFEPNWREELSDGDGEFLDKMLTDWLAELEFKSAAVPGTQRESIRKQAAADVKALQSERAKRRDAFLTRDGWRIEIDASAAPLAPHGFDPMNVEVVKPGEVLHKRYLKLANAQGSLETHGRAVLTEAAGAHPLFTGVRKATITGIGDEPAVKESDGVVELTSEKVSFRFEKASVSTDGKTVRVVLGGEGD